jgi:GNAT superfamily N-acetyltransferase
MHAIAMEPTKTAKTPVSPSDDVLIRSYRVSDREEVRSLLTDFPLLYPNNQEWLDRRLWEAVRGTAICRVAEQDGQLVGVTVLTPKAEGKVKLSTIFVGASARRKGIGTKLLDVARRDWIARRAEMVWVTVAHERLPSLCPLLSRHQFRFRCIDLARYGPSRDEAVFVWTPAH